MQSAGGAHCTSSTNHPTGSGWHESLNGKTQYLLWWTLTHSTTSESELPAPCYPTSEKVAIPHIGRGVADHKCHHWHQTQNLSGQFLLTNHQFNQTRIHTNITNKDINLNPTTIMPNVLLMALHCALGFTHAIHDLQLSQWTAPPNQKLNELNPKTVSSTNPLSRQHQCPLGW